MFTEEKEMNGNGVLITFRIPLSEWRVIRTSNSWMEVSEMVNRAQRAEDAMTLLLDKKISHLIALSTKTFRLCKRQYNEWIVCISEL